MRARGQGIGAVLCFCTALLCLAAYRSQTKPAGIGGLDVSTVQADGAQALEQAEKQAGEQSAETEPLSTLAAASEQTTQGQTGESAFSEGELAALDAFCEKQGSYFSVWAQDLTTGQTFCYGETTLYYAASTLKAPYALWLCRLADAGTLDLDEDLPNTHWGALADGALAAYNTSETVPMRAALAAMVSQSDNDATDLLMENRPGTESTGFVNFLEELGFSAADTCSMEQSGIEGMVSAADNALTMQTLYRYFASGASNGAWLRQQFCKATHEALYVPDGVAAAKKYGSWDGAFHDEIIVYAAHPYLLCCCTAWGDTEVDFPPEAVSVMQALGRMVYEDLNGTQSDS